LFIKYNFLFIFKRFGERKSGGCKYAKKNEGLAQTGGKRPCAFQGGFKDIQMDSIPVHR